jgi:hypothetical protein
MWNLVALMTYFERQNSTKPGVLKLTGLGHESCKVIAEWIKVPMPPSDALAIRLQLLQKMKDDVEAQMRSSAQQRAAGPASDALKLCETILAGLDTLQDDPDLPGSGLDFVTSVREKATSMQESIQARNSVTEPMLAALHNMNRAVGNWLEGRSRRSDNPSYDNPEEHCPF